MKILKISFQNINSLRGTHEIDFTKAPFTESSLFAITGPTGSGKSTILDVISLALFNQVPRIGKITRKEIMEKGAILTRNQKEAFAQVTYECSQGQFSSKWSIAYNRNNNLNDYELEICEADSGKIIDCKKSEVPARNEFLIGLNYDQFIKSVVLAQGEFAQFLRAKKEERGELLEKITGTGIYRSLGIRAFEKYKAISGDIRSSKERILALEIDLLESEAEKEVASELTALEKAAIPLEASIKSIEKQIELKSTIEKQALEISQLNSQKEKAAEQLLDFESAHGAKMKAHERVQKYAEGIRKWSAAKENKLSLQKDLAKLESDLSQNSIAKEDCLKVASNFIGTEVSPETIEEKIQQFSKQVSDLQQQKADKSKEYLNVKSQLERELKGIAFQLNEKSPEESLNQLRLLEASAQDEIKVLQSHLNSIDLTQIPAEKQGLLTHQERLYKAKEVDNNIKSLTAEIEKISKEEKAIVEKSATLPQEISTAKGKVELLTERFQKLSLEKENKELKASLEDHRSKLVEGEPCPLCGAMHHPFAEGLPPQDDELGAKISESSKELESWKKQLIENESKLKHNNERLDQVSINKNHLIKELETLQLYFEKIFSQFKEKEATVNWDELLEKNKFLMAKIDQFEKAQENYSSLQSAVPLHQQLNQLLKEGKSLKAELETLYTGKDIYGDANKLQQKWTTLLQEEKSLIRQKEDLRAKDLQIQNSLIELEEKLSPALTAEGYSSIGEAKEALLPEATYIELRDQKERITKSLDQLKSSIDLLQNKLVELQKSDVKKTKDELTTDLSQQRTSWKELNEKAEQLRRALKNHEENQKRIAAIQATIADKEKDNRRWKILDELIGSSTGKKFNDFAQDLSLSHLLLLANERLKDLNDRYKIDKPNKNEDDDGLVAIDEHMGGQRRSVKTLSGGETFILSLSMALALSDMASRNVEINSLFIDEGFGTLDPETLDQTLDTLERLQAESSKTIGIISHVDSLKERITTQIQLKRHGQGYSTLEIV
ncbi:AAA family ATPase [Marivirga sp. S37H4]|uniref:AAA family ATPase n=1 Tax=Marivirga aurantiaca TaxID=2802615 RepID=A0A935CDY6_9BACT|nr:SbcC/MukB-like Walker B domain-containing protein [Marivirga aurantiaca]MBK6267403.1 AAA family ATPase [Marivirga aurantiaca]